MKINNKYMIVLSALLISLFLLSRNDNDDWTAPQSGKKKKSKKANYLDLRYQAFKQDGHETVPLFPTSVADPFRVSGNYKRSGSGTIKTVKRNYALKGILLKTPLMAVIVDDSNESYVVGVGDSFAGVSVVDISTSSVILKDAYGQFTLDQK